MWQPISINWLWRYRLRSYVRNSIWIMPVLGIVAGLIAVRLVTPLDRALGLKSDFEPATALTVLGTLAASMFSFMVFVSSALLLAVQLASAQLTPRIIGFLFRDVVTKIALAVFVFTFTFTLGVLLRVKSTVPVFAGTFAAYTALASLAIFLYLLDHLGTLLRANGALRSIGAKGRRVIESVYPRLSDAPSTAPKADTLLTFPPDRTINSRREGAVLAFDTGGLIALARRYDCIIEIVPQVGDFVSRGDPLIRIYQGGEDLSDRTLRNSIAVGQERTFEQDPTFAIRIIVDIAAKALSPAINDPTTAVLALDEIHHLLRNVGKRQLDDRVVADSDGRFRLAYHTPGWADFVKLGVTEIRHYGFDSIRITRKLRAMLDNLIENLSERRAAPLRQELLVLQRSAMTVFTEPEDRALAGICDPQTADESHQKENNGSPTDRRLVPDK